MSHAIIAARDDAAIKELFKKIVEKEAEKVVLSKISTDEHRERTAGGR
ncbi:MAG TPA: hypothetical protein VKN36_17050 [Eudoraea sp.]|nr:hypothetical protein [Eudoraea sp.]